MTKIGAIISPYGFEGENYSYLYQIVEVIERGNVYIVVKDLCGKHFYIYESQIVELFEFTDDINLPYNYDCEFLYEKGDYIPPEGYIVYRFLNILGAKVYAIENGQSNTVFISEDELKQTNPIYNRLYDER